MNKFILFTILISSAACVRSQTVYEIYQDDNVPQYFKDLPANNKFYYSSDNFLDSLKDGIYLIYNVNRADSLSKFKEVEFRGEYNKGLKNGTFEHITYNYDRKKKRNLPVYVSRCEFVNGRKDGVHEQYNIKYNGHQPEISMVFFAEFRKGKLEGIYMEFLGGYPEIVRHYSNGDVVNTYIDNTQEKLKHPD